MEVRGSLQKGCQMMLDNFESYLPELDRERVFVTHISDNEQDALFLTSEVKRLAAPEDVRVTQAGSVISSHCGPGTAGILYFVK